MESFLATQQHPEKADAGGLDQVLAGGQEEAYRGEVGRVASGATTQNRIRDRGPAPRAEVVVLRAVMVAVVLWVAGAVVEAPVLPALL